MQAIVNGVCRPSIILVAPKLKIGSRFVIAKQKIYDGLSYDVDVLFTSYFNAHKLRCDAERCAGGKGETRSF